ncbi:GWT1-domain-containing protein [Lactarius akahatsu]|uniref:GPI-anchored wall transfer protein n=1 Tax=Lactarius akahatsu TaxID=416441 RepID=A0AAD4QA69_9AGAM|nr:GWT1-domain-containing protein [Lactarius akahatsu]
MALGSHQDDYKSSKESFVSGMTGSTVLHINMISFVALSSIALHSSIRSRFPPPKSFQFLSEWILLVAPLLLSMTLFADRPGILSAALLLPSALVYFLFPPHESGTPLPSGGAPSSPHTSPTLLRAPSFHGDDSSAAAAAPTAVDEPTTTRLAALSTYRAHMMLVTILAILAVDFPVFPRALAKCETYGVSLMDMGVGAFVFSQGIVSAIPLVKAPLHARASLASEIASVVVKCAPVLALGLVRVVLVKGTQYPEHVTEYGVHWNFFLTLALVPVLRVFLHPLFTTVPISLLGLLVALAHQLSLSAGLTSYVLDAPRQSLISANKEGLVSLTGYLAIHLLGLSTGTLVIPYSPSYFRRRQAAVRKRRASDAPARRVSMSMPHRENDKTATELFSYAVVYWTLFGISRYLHVGGPDASRRLVNLPYIMWVAAYNTTFLLCYMLLDLAFFPTPLAKSTYSPVSGLKVVRRPNDDDDDRDRTASPLVPPYRATTSSSSAPSPMPAPPLLEAINQNSLAVFLLANVATGAVNLSMQTMYASDGRAMGVLAAYAFGVCVFAWAVRGRRVWKL